MTEETKQKTQALEGKAALELWRQGKVSWNSWIKQHPNGLINFAYVDFSIERDSKGKLSFAGYHFGDGNVDFTKSTFGNGTVDFSAANFGNGGVYFSDASFGDGTINFSHSAFGTGTISFSGATFGKGSVKFAGTNFGNGNVDFSNVNFGNGGVYFSNATFGPGEINFSSVLFGNGGVNFSKAFFNSCDIDFSNTVFGNGEVNFTYMSLNNGGVNFTGTSFGKGNVIFNQANISELIFKPISFEADRIAAQGLSIKHLTIFLLPKRAKNLKSFDLQGASFDGPLFLIGNIDIIPDIRATRSPHQVELSALNVKLRRTWQRLSWPPKLSRVAADPKDGSRLRRLKEIAETNKDHQAALRFSADENRAKRWIETSWFGSVLDMAFSAFSDYGQNILRPFVALIVLTAASMGLYKTLGTATFTNWWAGWAQGAVLSASNSLPFLPQSRDLRTDALTALYGTDHSFSVDALMITQGALSFIFLFLIGLGLRNRFRL